MPLELVPDEFGTVMELFRCPNGRLVAPDLNPDTVYNMRNIPLRDDDIMLCSYAKSGCHWLWDVLRYLRFGVADDLDKVDKETHMVEYNSLETLEQLQSPRILNNHGFFEDQPTDLFNKKVKVVFVYRNIKDLAVSYYHHHTRFPEYKYQDTFTHYIRRFVAGLVDNGSVFEYLRGWEEGIHNTPGLNIHVVSYEDMKELLRLGKIFLGPNTALVFPKGPSPRAQNRFWPNVKKKKKRATMYLDHEGKPVMYGKEKLLPYCRSVGERRNHFTVAATIGWTPSLKKKMGNPKFFKFLKIQYNLFLFSKNF
ncbi:unnamed protein product [Candidula unifasciata]|uniref:Sulfotransferase domain-containing protein n=1 Tax=Candidula unifasciata TaxID=100452 RepID=A0A8S3YJJ9_9EUPU|nr:unnamed protein product [Candidula unifasciata]